MSSDYSAIYQVLYHLVDRGRQERDVKQKRSKLRASRFKKLGLGSLESISPPMGGFRPQWRMRRQYKSERVRKMINRMMLQ
jgi:hypothetical protein